MLMNEFFALPIGLKPIPIFGSLQLFTSESLKKSYIESMSSMPKMSNISGTISKMVENEMIIPCFLTKGILSTILFKMFPTDRARNDEQFFKEEMRNVFGFYESGSKKIYILISNQINKFGFTNNERIYNVTVHESCHMASSKNQSKFMNSFRIFLSDYYTNYFTKIFSLDFVDNKLINDIIKLLFTKFEKSTIVTQSNLKKYHELMMKFRDSSQAGDSFDKIVHDFFVAIRLFTSSTSQFIKSMNQFSHITDPLQTSYSDTFGGVDPGNIPIQELIFPSEVIAIGSEITHSKDIINRIFALL